MATWIWLYRRSSIALVQGSVDHHHGLSTLYDEDLGELGDLTERHLWSNEVLCESIRDAATRFERVGASTVLKTSRTGTQARWSGSVRSMLHRSFVRLSACCVELCEICNPSPLALEFVSERRIHRPVPSATLAVRIPTSIVGQ